MLDWDGLGLDGLDEPDCMDCDGFGMNDLAIVAFSGPSCGGLTWDTLVFYALNNGVGCARLGSVGLGSDLPVCGNLGFDKLAGL